MHHRQQQYKKKMHSASCRYFFCRSKVTPSSTYLSIYKIYAILDLILTSASVARRTRPSPPRRAPAAATRLQLLLLRAPAAASRLRHASAHAGAGRVGVGSSSVLLIAPHPTPTVCWLRNPASTAVGVSPPPLGRTTTGGGPPH